MISVEPGGANLVLAGGGLNFDPAVFRLYNEHYGANDPYAEPGMRNRRIGVIQGEELVSRGDLFKSELYNEVLVRYDLAHMSLMTLMSPESSTQAGHVLPLWASPKHGPMDAASIHLRQVPIPHVQTALLLRSKIATSQATNLFSETALEAMSIAAILINSNGRIRHMNQRGRLSPRRKWSALE
ncbi:MAG TPA: hypothetical protein VGM27_14980 [Acidobacteriaceae bacterium]